MRRADRLLPLVQALRRARGPVTAQALAEELEASRRTVHRDVLDLQAARVPIEGEAGGDAALARAAQDVLAKVAAVLPTPLAAALEHSGLLVPSRAPAEAAKADEAAFGPHVAVLRRGARERARLRIGYVNAGGAANLARPSKSRATPSAPGSLWPSSRSADR